MEKVFEPIPGLCTYCEEYRPFRLPKSGACRECVLVAVKIIDTFFWAIHETRCRPPIHTTLKDRLNWIEDYSYQNAKRQLVFLKDNTFAIAKYRPFDHLQKSLVRRIETLRFLRIWQYSAWISARRKTAVLPLKTLCAEEIIRKKLPYVDPTLVTRDCIEHIDDINLLSLQVLIDYGYWQEFKKEYLDLLEASRKRKKITVV